MKLHAHKRRDPRKISERNIHLAVADALNFFAAPGVWWTHIANERRCSPREGAFLKRMGVKPGIADIFILIPGAHSLNPWPMTCFLELKSETGRLSLEQRIFRDDVEKLGCNYAMPRSVDEALSILTEWGALKGMARSSISSAALRGKAA